MSEKAIQLGDLQEVWNSVSRYYCSAMALARLTEGQTSEWTEDIAASFRLFGECYFYYTQIPLDAKALWNQVAQRNEQSYLHQAVNFAEIVRGEIWAFIRGVTSGG